MPSPSAIVAPPSIARFQLSSVNFRLFWSKPFSFTHFRKNASVNPLDSHSFKTKDLKPYRFTHFQKKVGVPLGRLSSRPGICPEQARGEQRDPSVQLHPRTSNLRPC